MPQYPDSLRGISPEGMDPDTAYKLKQELDARQRNMRPAFRDPMLGRAVGKLDSLYPNDMTDVDIDSEPWEDRYAGSTVLGGTTLGNLGKHHQKIRVNPVIGTAFKDDLMENTLAHELQHVRQLRSLGDFDKSLQHEKAEFALPYEKRPDELEAQQASEKYWRDRKLRAPDGFRTNLPPNINMSDLPMPPRRSR